MTLRDSSLFLFFLSFFILTSSGEFEFSEEWTHYKIAQSFVTGQVVNESPKLPQFPNMHWRQVLDFIPLYILGNWIGPGISNGGYLFSTFLNAFFGAGLCLIFFHFLLLLNYSKKISLWMTFILMFSTMVLVYSKSVQNVVQEAFFSVSTFYFLLKFKKIKQHCYFYISLMMMIFGCLTRYTFVLTLPAWIFLLIQTKTDFKKTFLYPVFLLGPIIFFLCFKLSITWDNFSLWTNTYFEMVSLRQFLNGLRGLLLSPGKSIFVFNPILFLSVFLFPSFYKKFKTEALVIIILSMSYLLFYANVRFFGGDPTWGPRYLLAIIPFLILPVAESFSSGKKYIIQFCYFFSGIGIAIQLVGVCISYSHYTYITNYRYDLPRFFYHYPNAIDYYNNPKLNAVYQLGKEIPNIFRRMKTFRLEQISSDNLKKLNAKDVIVIDKKVLKEVLDKNITDNVFNFWFLKSIYMPGPMFKFRLILFTFILGIFLLSASTLLYAYRRMG